MTLTNPHSPALVGDEFYGVRPVNGLALSAEQGYGVVLPSTSAESIVGVSAYLKPTIAPVRAAVDIYDLANPIAASGDLVQAISYPTATYPAVPVADATWTKQAAGAGGSGAVTAYDGTAWANIDNVFLATDDLSTGDDVSKIIWTPISHTASTDRFFGASGTFVDWNIGGAVSMTGKRIAYVDILAVLQVQMFYPATVWGIHRGGTGGNTTFLTDGFQVAPGTGWRFVYRRFPYNKATGLRWVIGDLASFTTGTLTRPWGLRIKPGVPSNIPEVVGNVEIASLGIRIGVVPERRVAQGYISFSDVGKGWHTMPLQQPDGSAGAWAKASGATYLALFSLTGGNPGSVALGAVDSSGVSGHENDNYATYRGARAGFREYVVPDDATDPERFHWCPAILLNKSSGISTDGQPYAHGQEFVIDASNTVSQTVVVPSGTYQLVNVLLKATADSFGQPVQNAPVTITLKSGVTTVATASVPVGTIPPDGKMHVVSARFAASHVLNGTYIIELTSTSTVPWLTAGSLTRAFDDTVNVATATVAAGISDGGVTGRGTFAGTGYDWLDFPYQVGTTPPTPTGLAAVAVTFDNLPADLAFTHLPALNRAVHLSWTATADGGAFGYYEVQRLIGAVWYPVAFVTSEAAPRFYDVEAPRGEALSYRLRVVRATGAIGPFATFGAVTVPIPAAEACNISLASNSAPERTLTMQDSQRSGARAWKPRVATQGKTIDILGRTRPVAFYPAGSSGDEFDRTLVLAGDDANITNGSATPDKSIFLDLEALLHDHSLPYVAYVDGYGRVVFVSAAIKTETRVEKGGLYFADVSFVEVADAPVAVTTASPWVPS